MKNYLLITTLAISLQAGFARAESPAVNTLLQEYASQGATTASAERGKKMWDETFRRAGEFPERSCSSCHTLDLTSTGKHVKTGKAIKPMTPAANPKRLTDAKKIEKWFRRNCKWTLGRKCSLQEKADFLAYIDNPS